MKLAVKLIASLLAVVMLFLCVDGYLRVQRAMSFYKQDVDRDSRILGHALRPILEEAWRSQGEQYALSQIERANQGEQAVQIRWVWLDAKPGDPHCPHIPPERIGQASVGHTVLVKEVAESGAEYVYSYLPLEVSANRPGALEFAENLSPLNEYLQGLVWREIALGAAILLVSTVVVSILGVTLVGRPLRSLMEKTMQVSKGNFAIPVRLRGKDELGELATALNKMGEDLAEAQERVRAETETRITALEQLRHADRLATVGRLVSGVAHELGTPLNIILGRASQIARSSEGSDVSACADIIRNQADRMTRLVRQLLSFARPRKPQRLPVDLRKLVDQGVELLQPLARKKDVDIRWTSPEEPCVVKIDSTMIQHVLTNLVDNAIGVVGKGGTVKLSLKTSEYRPPTGVDRRAGHYVCLSVLDDGAGISEENMSHIFDPFFTTKEIGEGTGLGLSIAYGIVREHGGWIDVDSKPGEGSRFTVYVPMEE